MLRRMTGRDPQEPFRSSTPLELLFDLCFVVAVAQNGAQLHHSLDSGDVGPGLLGYAMVFFVIWWAWMNFAWFAAAYDTDDVPYRLLTLVQIAGVLVLAAGVSAAFEHYDFRAVAAGYLLMRVAMIGQWLRAAREHPSGRPRPPLCHRYRRVADLLDAAAAAAGAVELDFPCDAGDR
ncbi:hypothetical protein GCM10029978_037010 [Actinoallomurus acanthiterrae]